MPRRRLLSTSAMLLAAIALMISFRVAVLRGFDHTIGSDAWGRFSFAIGAALTDIDGGVPGYVIDARVESVLHANGLTGDPALLSKLGLSFPENLRNSTLLDSVFERAAGSDYPPPRQLRGASGDDLGFVDFIKLSFDLFGYNLVGFLLTYFLVLGTEIVAYLVAFRNRPSALCVLASAVCAHAAILVSRLFDFVGGLGSVANPRWLSALAFLPVLHVGLLMLRAERPTLLSVGLVGIQAICAGFAISIRASAGWVALAVLILGILVAAKALRHRSAGWRVATRPLWPAAVFLLGLVGYVVALLYSLNPVYAENRDLSHHAVWHSVLYSLQNFNPYWNSRFGSLAPGADGDQMPWVAAELYREQHLPTEPDPEYYINGHLTLSGLEHYTRAVVLEIVREDPSFVLATFLYYKPKVALSEARLLIFSFDRIAPLALVMLVGAALWLAALLSSCKVERNQLLYATIALVGALTVSMVPNILTVATGQVLGDSFFILVTAFGAWGLWSLATVIGRVRSLFQVKSLAIVDHMERK